MLRASAEANDETIDLRGVGDVSVDSGVRHGHVLGAVVEAAVLRDADEMDIARERAVQALGSAGAVRAIAVTANFEMMNRLLDAVGIGPPASRLAIGDAIGIPLPSRFR
ncbi:MAG: hypothetical protein HKN44_06150 [Ilumatobacter sp.]|nr:hypothetical protein [Ilumatobacter sp.]